MADKFPELRGGWKYALVGADMVAATVVGVVIGYWLDKIFGTGPWLLIVFFVLGVAAGFISVYRRMQFDTKQQPLGKRK